MVSKFKSAIFFSNLSFVTIVIVGVYSYRFLWINLDAAIFNSWIALFELSFFLLLLDLGFTHSFIKRFSRTYSDNKDFSLSILNMRFSLFTMGFFSLILIVILAFVLGIIESVGIGPVILLALSVWLTLVSYADTAILKVQEKFKIIYLINIIANLFYLLFIVFLPISWGIWIVAFAVIFRSLIIYFGQSFYVTNPFILRYNKLTLNKDFSQVLYLNGSYFALFAFDAAILVAMSINPIVLSLIIIYKKYYDLLRGFFDSMMSVINVYFLKFDVKEKLINKIFILFGIFSFLMSFLFSSLIMKLWLNDFKSNLLVSISLSVSTFSIVMYRYYSNKMYFKTGSNLLFLLKSVFLIKIIFLIFILLNISISLSYFLQSIMVLFLSYIISRVSVSKEGCESV